MKEIINKKKNYVNKRGRKYDNTIHTYIHTYYTLKKEKNNNLKEEKIVKTVKKEIKNLIKPMLGYG